MKRFFSIFLMAFSAFFVLQAAVVTFDFSTAEGITAMGYEVPAQGSGTNLAPAGAVTVGGVTLSATDGATPTRIWNSQGSFIGDVDSCGHQECPGRQLGGHDQR